MINNKMENSFEKIKTLATQGITLSFVYGKCGDLGVLWTVNAMKGDTFEEFKKPFVAETFEQAVMIAEIECNSRGWYCNEPS